MNRRIALTSMILAATAASGVALAGDDLTSLSYISYLERYATVRPGQGGETLDAVVNMPVLAGDRLDTARGSRVEVQLADGISVWVDEFTTLDFDALAYSREDAAPRTALYLSDGGGVAVEIPSTALGSGSLRVDARVGSIFLNRPGLYRVVAKSGELGVEVHQGLAELPEGYGSTLLRASQQAWIEDDGDIEKSALSEDYDDFWAWVQERRQPSSGGPTAQYVDAGHGGRAAVLDSYGEWVYVPSYSTHMWRPRVASTWTPYSSGRWVWTPVGWTWVAYEPWGWYPYHYGSWYWDVSIGWAWCWDRVWGPSWVHWLAWDGYVGWCPRGYYDYWYWNQHGGRWNGDGRGGHRRPDRWSDVALDFHGRVRLRDIDSRPWTFVAADRFTDSRLDRVRLDPSRLLRDLPADRFGEVRSGPLLTRSPDRSSPTRIIDDVFRRNGDGQPLPEMSSFLRRQEGGQRQIGEVPVRSVRTGDVVRDSRPVGGDGGTRRPIVTRGERGIDDDGQPGRTSVRDGVDRRDPRSLVDRGGDDRVVRRPVSPSTPSSSRQSPPPAERSPARHVERDSPSREAPPPARSVPGTTREVSPPARSNPGSSREVDRARPAPPPARQDSPRPSARSRVGARPISPGDSRFGVLRREASASRRFESAPRLEFRTAPRELRARATQPRVSAPAPRVAARASGSTTPRAQAPSRTASSSPSRQSGSSPARAAGSGSTRSSGASTSRSPNASRGRK